MIGWLPVLERPPPWTKAQPETGWAFSLVRTKREGVELQLANPMKPAHERRLKEFGEKLLRALLELRRSERGIRNSLDSLARLLNPGAEGDGSQKNKNQSEQGSKDKLPSARTAIRIEFPPTFMADYDSSKKEEARHNKKSLRVNWATGGANGFIRCEDFEVRMRNALKAKREAQTNKQ